MGTNLVTKVPKDNIGSDGRDAVGHDDDVDKDKANDGWDSNLKDKATIIFGDGDCSNDDRDGGDGYDIMGDIQVKS